MQMEHLKICWCLHITGARNIYYSLETCIFTFFNRYLSRLHSIFCPVTYSQNHHVNYP